MRVAQKSTNSIAGSSETELRDKFQSLLCYTTDMIYFKDLNSVFTLCSDSCTKRLAGPSGCVIGKTDFDFFDADCATKFYSDEQEIIRTGKPVIGQIIEEVRNGQRAWVFSSKIPLRDLDGNITGTFGISRDITAQKRTEEKLAKANAQLVEASRRAGKAEVATNVIHNIGNVLTSIKVAISQSDSICDDIGLEKLVRVADLITENADNRSFFQAEQRGSHIPDYLRGLSKALDTDKSKLAKELADCKRHLEHIRNIVSQQEAHASASSVIEKVDISELVAEAIQMSSSSLKNHRIKIVQDFEEGLFAETDKHQILQIIVNLIRNAKHACLDSSNPSRKITVAVAPHGKREFQIRIIDNGIGIAAENMPQLFRYGFTTREQGSGFGLHGSSNSAKQLGGTLHAESDGLGRGAAFVLTLPGKLESHPSKTASNTTLR